MLCIINASSTFPASGKAINEVGSQIIVNSAQVHCLMTSSCTASAIFIFFLLGDRGERDRDCKNEVFPTGKYKQKKNYYSDF